MDKKVTDKWKEDKLYEGISPTEEAFPWDENDQGDIL
jgi:hypothetical protein